MFHHNRPLQHCLFTMVCGLLSLPPAFWTAWVPPTHTYPHWSVGSPTWFSTGSEKLRATSTAGLCESLNLPSAARRLQEVWKFGALGLLWLVGPRCLRGWLSMGGFGAKKTLMSDADLFGDRWCWVQVVLTWVEHVFSHGLLKKSAWICSNNSDWWSIQVLVYGGVDSKYENPPQFFKTTVISLEKWKDLSVNPTLQYKDPPCLYGSMATGHVWLRNIGWPDLSELSKPQKHYSVPASTKMVLPPVVWLLCHEN